MTNLFKGNHNSAKRCRKIRSTYSAYGDNKVHTLGTTKLKLKIDEVEVLVVNNSVQSEPLLVVRLFTEKSGITVIKDKNILPNYLAKSECNERSKEEALSMEKTSRIYLIEALTAYKMNDIEIGIVKLV